MLRTVATTILKTFGWQVSFSLPPRDKFVLIGAPHTSNWDFLLGIVAAWSVKLDVSWMGKHTIFRWPLGWFFRAIGGLPVQRGHALNLIQQMADRFASSERLVLALAPEGTRITLPLTHQEYANLVGATREMVTQVLGKMADEGLIHTKKRQIVIPDRSKLLLVLKNR